MSHYESTLEEARAASTKGAKFYIPKLYHILTDEEHKTAEDARQIIEHDLIEYWSKATVVKFLPHEAKDEEKAKAGKAGAEATNLVLAGGQSVTTGADGKIPADLPTTDSKQFFEDLSKQRGKNKGKPEEPTELELLKIQVKQQQETIQQKDELLQAEKIRGDQLEDALHQTEQFKPATAFEEKEIVLVDPFNKDEIFDHLQKKADGVHSFYYDAYGIDLFKNRELSQLKNSGVRVFKRLYFEV